VAKPAGAATADEWQRDGFRMRAIGTEGDELDVCIRGIQAADGTMEELSIQIPGPTSQFTAATARELAAPLIGAADEIDRLAGATPEKDC
jgi:DNA-binding IclR family transcriptional regulator